MTSISNVSTVSPENLVKLEHMDQVSQIWLDEDPASREKLQRICINSGVKKRYFSMPHKEVLALNGMQHRAQQFETKGRELLARAVDNAINNSEFKPEDFAALVFTSCSVPSIPCIDAAVILDSQLPNNISRVPIYQHGCAGGVIGLSLASKLASAGKPVIMASTELCSLVFQPENHSGAHLVGAAIFADGAAATIVSPAPGQLEFVDSESTLLPDSRHLMGYDIFDDGFHLRLDRNLPSALVKNAPKLVNNFLERNDLSHEQIDYWLFHPGGIKILDFFSEIFSLQRENCRWSYDVLRDFGNLSSATILFVMNAFLKYEKLKKDKNVLVMGIGPGLTIELILLRS